MFLFTNQLWACCVFAATPQGTLLVQRFAFSLDDGTRSCCNTEVKIVHYKLPPHLPRKQIMTHALSHCLSALLSIPTHLERSFETGFVDNLLLPSWHSCRHISLVRPGKEDPWAFINSASITWFFFCHHGYF